MAPIQPDDSGYVWIVETGDYEQRGIFLVAASLEAAIEGIKEIYGPPYRVRWESPTFDRDGDASILGHFEQVVGKSTQHVGRYDITRHDIVGYEG